jgi:hypothetical protein
MMKKLLLLLFIFTFQLSIFHSCAQTNVSGFINANTTWTLAGSPYIVVGNALISQGYTLTIDPGVVVKFDTAKALQIDGTLIAIGTAANRITFTSSSANPVRGSWAKLHFSDYATDAVYDAFGNYVSGSIMKYCDVMYGGGLGYGNIQIEGSEPYISQCNIKYSSSVGIYSSGSTYVLDSSLSADNSGWGLYFTQYYPSTGGLVIRGDTLRNNSGGGLLLGQHSLNCTTQVLNNFFISDSTSGAIQLDGYQRNIYIQHNSFLNNYMPGGGIIGFIGLSTGEMVRIDDNIFNSNTASQGMIYFSSDDSDVGINRNEFLNNTGNNGIIQNHANLTGDTISCNRFQNNQTLNAALNLGTAGSGTGIVINNNIFDGNICNGGLQIAILTIEQGSGIIDFSNNIVKNNSVNNGKLCSIVADVTNTMQSLKIHHNEFSNNTASKVLFISGSQISNTSPDFCYLKQNNFLDITIPYTIYNSIPYGSPNLHIDSNYWSSTSTAYIDGVIYDYFDFANQSIVYYSPILQVPALIDTTCPSPITTVASDIEKPINSFNIYPNPTHNTFTISLNQWTVDNVQLTVFDISGRCVYEKQIRNFAQSEIRNNFSPGIYFVKVSDGERSTTQKLIIQ